MASQVGSVINDKKLNVDHNGDVADGKTNVPEPLKKGGLYCSSKQVGVTVNRSTCKESCKLSSGSRNDIAASRNTNSENFFMRTTCDWTKKNRGTKLNSNILKSGMSRSHKVRRGKQIWYSGECFDQSDLSEELTAVIGELRRTFRKGLMHDDAKCIKGEISCMEFPIYYTKNQLNETGMPHLYKPTRGKQKQLMECLDGIDVSEDLPVDISMRDLVCSNAKCIQPEGESFEIEEHAAEEKLQEAGASAEEKTNAYEAFNTGGFSSRKSVGTLSNQSMRKKNVSMKKNGRFPPWKPAGIASNQSLRKENPSEKKGGGFPSRKSVERASSQSMQKKSLLEKKGEGTGSENESLADFGFESTGPEYRHCFFQCMSLSRNSDCESESEGEGETYSCSEGEMRSAEWISLRDLVCSPAKSIRPKGETSEIEEHAAEEKLQEAGAYAKGKRNVFVALNTGEFPSRKSVGTLSNQSLGKKNVSMKKKERFPPWKPAGIASNQSLRKENPSEKKGGGFPSMKSVERASSQSMQKKNPLEQKGEGTDSDNESLPGFRFHRNGVIDRSCCLRGMAISYSDSESEIEFETYSSSESEMGSVERAEQLRVWAEKPWLQGWDLLEYV